MAQEENHGPPQNRRRSVNGDETVLAPRPIFGRRKDSSSDNMRDEARREVALVEGSTPHLSAETRDLLRNRLRIAAILFFVGFFAFLIRWFFYWNEWGKPRAPADLLHARDRDGRARRFRRAAVPPLLAIRLTKLRVAELVDFRLPGIVLSRQRLDTRHCTSCNLPAGQSRIEIIVTPWLLLIFTYAMFIPNTWQRAAAVLGVIGAMPIAILAYFDVAAERSQTLLADNRRTAASSAARC